MNLHRVRPEDYFTPAYFVGMYGFHIIISNSYGPLRYSLPLSLADKSYSAAQEEISEAADKPNANKGGAPTLDSSIQKEAESGGSRDEIRGGEDDDEDYTLDGPKDFNHPASVDSQRIIWIPTDTLGLANEEVEDLRQKQILVSTADATMNAKGQVDIQGSPPGELGIIWFGSVEYPAVLILRPSYS